MMTSFITIFMLVQLSVNVSMQNCTGKDGIYCCYGFKWDLAHNKCIPCEDGFFGHNCAFKCPYPRFGKECQSLCLCEFQNCDHANGCIQPSKSISNVTEADTTMNLTNILRETKETKQEMVNTIMFGMIGLAVVSFIIYMIYIFTIALEKDSYS